MDQESRRRAEGAYSVAWSVFALIFAVVWCCIAAAMGAWFMLLFGVPLTGIMGWRLAMCIKMNRGEKPREPWEQAAPPSFTEAPPRAEGICPYCGRRTEGDFKFCPRCGRRL